jgi:hypothetical protein
MTVTTETLMLAPAVSALDPIDLAAVLDNAARLTRTDRKYLVEHHTAEALIARVADRYRVLSIQGRRWATYRSTYFDTPGLTTCRDHVQKRRRRWKVRSRLYVEDQLCRIEVKTTSGSDTTVKHVGPSHPRHYGALAGSEAQFVDEVLRGYGAAVDAAGLQPTAEVSYRRVTLADTAAGTRITLDHDVRAVLDDHHVWLDPGFVVIETKGGPRPSAADRVLGDLGARPRSFSKYVSAASLLRADIPDNDVRAMRGRLLHSARSPYRTEGG